MNRKRLALLAFLTGALLSTGAFAGQLLKKTFDDKPYAGSRERKYQIYVPNGYTGSVAVPMVMVLHGCKQTEQNMIDETRFKDLAEQYNFIVVYPFITTYDGQRNPNCWGFWFDHHVHEGAGEAEDLYQIALEVESQFQIDPDRRYIAGLSSGAGMSVVLAVVQSEYFAAAGAAAGLPYPETSSSVGFVCANPGTFKPVPTLVSGMQAEQQTPEEKRTVPIMTIHSNRDCTVNKKNSENIRDSWLERYGASPTPVETRDCTQEGVPCTHKKYGAAGRSVVETVFYEGESGNFIGQGSHYWVGDNSGEYANSTGPSASELLWDFFTRHPYAENQAPSVAISSESVDGTSITVSGSASDADGSIAEVAVALEGKHPQSSKPASGTNSWSVTLKNVPDNAFYTALVTAKDNKGATATIKGGPLKVGNPPPNEPPKVSIETVTVNGTCVSVSGRASDIDGTVTKVEVELGSSGFKTGALDGNAYSYEECALKAGTYTTQARAIDNLGAPATIKGREAKVEALKTEVSDWQAHMSAGRLKIYRAPCSSIGFGSCDTGFHTIFLTHSFNPFALYKDPASDNWYLDPGSIRASVR